MDIASNIAAIQQRIAEITGASAAPAPASGPAAGSGIDGLPVIDPRNAGSFASLVQAALASAGGTPAASFNDEAAALGARADAPAMVPPEEIERLVTANAGAYGVDPALVKAVIANESGFNANATSRVGAQGLMQLMPGTAAGLGVANAYDPVQNVAGGTRYLRGLLDRFGGDMKLAVAAYNAGPGAVEKYDGVPPYAETQNYVQNVLASYEKYRTQQP